MDGRTDIQTDGDYIKRVVTPFGTTRLKNEVLFQKFLNWSFSLNVHVRSIVQRISSAWLCQSTLLCIVTASEGQSVHAIC